MIPSGRTPTPLPSAHDQRARGGSARGRYPRPLCPCHVRNEAWWEYPIAGIHKFRNRKHCFLTKSVAVDGSLVVVVSSCPIITTVSPEKSRAVHALWKEKAGESFIMADALPGAAAAPVSALPGRGSRAHASSGLASSGASGPPKHLDVAASPTTPHTFDALPWKATTMEHMQRSQPGERSATRCEGGSSAAFSATSAQGGRASLPACAAASKPSRTRRAVAAAAATIAAAAAQPRRWS